MSDLVRPPEDQLDEIDHVNSARELRISELYLAKRPVAEIMRLTGVTHWQYAQYMKQIAARFHEQAMRNGLERKGEELAQLDRLQAMYEDAWERSKSPRTTTKKKVVLRKKQKPQPNKDGIVELFPDNGPTHEVAEVNTTEEELVGDERFLKGILACIDRRIKLYGLDDPDKLMVMSISDTNGSVVDMEARLARYRNVLALPGGYRGDPSSDPGHHDPGEPMDTERPAPEAGGVLDVSGRVR